MKDRISTTRPKTTWTIMALRTSQSSLMQIWKTWRNITTLGRILTPMPHLEWECNSPFEFHFFFSPRARNAGLRMNNENTTPQIHMDMVWSLFGTFFSRDRHGRQSHMYCVFSLSQSLEKLSLQSCLMLRKGQLFLPCLRKSLICPFKYFCWTECARDLCNYTPRWTI